MKLPRTNHGVAGVREGLGLVLHNDTITGKENDGGVDKSRTQDSETIRTMQLVSGTVVSSLQLQRVPNCARDTDSK